MVFACDDFKLSLLRSAAAPYNSPMTYAETVRSGGRAALQAAESFLMRSGPVYETLRRITDRLSELGIPYSVAGGMALVAHGHNRTTVDVGILVTAEGLRRIHQALDGLGYVPPFAGSKSLRDTTTAVRIEFLVCGAFPGDGKPKPIAFPDPTEAAVAIDGINYLRLPRLIELKLASGMTGGVARLKDFADVVELIRLLNLDERFATQLNPYVRDKFIELKRGLDSSPGVESIPHEEIALGRGQLRYLLASTLPAIPRFLEGGQRSGLPFEERSQVRQHRNRLGAEMMLDAFDVALLRFRAKVEQ